jgi:hypothetical protein
MQRHKLVSLVIFYKVGVSRVLFEGSSRGTDCRMKINYCKNRPRFIMKLGHASESGFHNTLDRVGLNLDQWPTKCFKTETQRTEILSRWNFNSDIYIFY